MLHIKETIVVEGKYDREILKKVTDAPIICTGGFSLYTNKAIMTSIRTMAEKTGIIVLTDSDSAGFRIRNYIKQCVDSRGIVKHAYIPSVRGKERRKDKAGKEGLLGVEGMSEKFLEDILKTVTEVQPTAYTGNSPQLTKATLYEDGLAGRDDSAELRRHLAAVLGLPARISANALIDIINKAYGYDEYKKALASLDSK